MLESDFFLVSSLYLKPLNWGAIMGEERARRKLSGILSADAVGYSRLM
jgi:hypothetical protein